MKDSLITDLEEYCDKQRLDALDEDDPDKAGEAHQRYMESMTLLRETEHEAMEYYDREDRRELEKQKNSDAKEIELKKQSLSIPKVALELAKIVIPVAVSAAMLIRAQDHSERFEASGCAYTSKSSKIADGLRPNIWKF